MSAEHAKAEASAADDVAATPTPQPTGKARRKGKQKRGRWYWRWTRRLAISAVVARVLLWLFLEQLANFGAGFAGLSVSWRSATLSLSGLSLHIEDLVVRDADDADAPPLLTAQELIADLSMRQLLSGQLSVVDAGVVGGRVTVHRNADGTLRLPAAWLEPAPVELPEEPEPPSDEPLRFELPCWIASTRLHDLQLDFVDHTTEPASHRTGKLDLDIADVGFPDRNGAVRLRVHAPQLCDELFLHTQIQAAPRNAEVDFQLVVRGFRPRRFDLPEDLIEALEDAHVVDLRLGGDLRAQVLDSAPKVPALDGELAFGLSLDGVDRSTIDATFGPTDPTADGLIMPLGLTVHADGIVDSLRLEDARLEAVGDHTGVTATLAADGLTCVRIRPMLEAAGLQLPRGGFALRATADAEFGESMTFQLSRLTLDSEEGRMLALPKIAVQDLRTVDGTLAIERVELVGPEVDIVKEQDGTLVVGGLRAVPVPLRALAQPDPQPAPQPTPQPSANPDDPQPTAALPKLRLGSLSWSGAAVRYTDRGFLEPATLTLTDVDVRGDALAFGEEAPPGRVQIAFGAPDVAKVCRGELLLKPRVDGCTTQLQWRTEGLTLAGLQPWLDDAGIRSELTDGTLALVAEADLQLLPRLQMSAALSNVQLENDGTRWLSLRALRGDDLTIDEGGIDLGTWRMQDPYVMLHRDAEQMLHACGLRLGGPTPAVGKVEPPPPTAPRTRRNPFASDARDRPGDAPSEGDEAPAKLRLRHGAIDVSGATLQWSDEAAPEKNRAIGLDLSAGPQNGTDQPVDIRAELKISQARASVLFEANLVRTPDYVAAKGTLAANDLVAAELAPFLPDGVRCTFDEGDLSAGFVAHADLGGGGRLFGKLRDVKVTDRDVEAAAIDELTVDLPKFDDELWHVKELVVRGVRASVAKTADELLVPGFALAAAPTAAPAPAPAETQQTGERDGGERPTPRGAPLLLPKVQIDKALVQLERFEFRDRSDGERAPITASFGLELQQPWLGDPAAEQPKPMTWAITGEVAPLGVELTAEALANPFDLSPTLDVTFALEHFDTTRLVELVPSLATTLRGEAKQLSLTAALHARLGLKRRNAGSFDFSRPFGAEFVFEDVVVQDRSNETVYAKIAAIDVITRAIDPNSGSVLLRAVDIDEPILRAHKDAEGTHVAGFVLLEPPAAAEPPTQPASNDADAPADEPAPQPVAQPEPTPPATPAAKPGSTSPKTEFAIDRLRVMGLAVDYRDATTVPPTHLSLADTDLELSRFSTRSLSEPLPMSFSAELRGGDVELEKRVIKSSVITGFLTSSAEALVGVGDQHTMQQRPMLDLMTVDGQLTLFPMPKGRINVAVDRLELPAFRGLAKQGGVDLSDGLFDARITVDLKGYDGVHIRSENVFTWLALTEPPDGPISTYLRLPAPLQTVLFLLRNNDDEQRIPLIVDVPAGPEGQGALVDAIVESLAKLIGDSVTSYGARAAGAVTDIFLAGDSEVPDVRAMLPYQPGSPLPDDADLDRLLRTVAGDDSLVVVLTHNLGAGDLPHAQELANPPADVLEGTIEGLNKTRDELEAQRTPIAQDVVALYAAGKVQEAIRRQEELLAIDTHLGELLVALSSAIDQLGNPNARAASRRTRSAAKALAEARLDAAIARMRTLRKDLGADRFERRAGRGVPVDGVPEGGCVIATLKRRSTQAPVTK